MRLRPRLLIALVSLLLVGLVDAGRVSACTGITLKSEDQAVVFARSMEWGTFDLKSRLVIVPRGYEYKSHLEANTTGLTWKTKYGVVGLDALEKDYLVDGMNEHGLSVNVFYHPDFAEYAPFKASEVSKTISAVDVCQFLLTTCASVADVKSAMGMVNVVGIVEPALGIAPPVHLMVVEPSGASVVIEFTKGRVVLHDAPLGVITNAPNYDWHITNLRNFINLSAVTLPTKRLQDLDFTPLGGGSGMIGLPGDFTPPSRFVRAVAFTQTARKTATGPETMYEAFRILDNFNLPLGSAEGGGAEMLKGMRSATIWTTAYDTKNRIIQYHTMHNRRVRQVDLKRIDFATPSKLTYLLLDKVKKQDIEDVTPSNGGAGSK